MKKSEFFNAIKNGDIKAVSRALKEGMSANVTNEEGEQAVDVACFYEHTDIAELLRDKSLIETTERSAENEAEQNNPICIVGYSNIFPGGNFKPFDFWNTLSSYNHKMTEVPPERWSVEEFYSPDKNAPGKMYTRRGGFIDQSPYAFDADFFKVVPKEAETMDPQQRLTLEASWFALEHAGINPQTLVGKQVGVYCGIMTHDYTNMIIQSGLEHNNFIGTGNGASVLSGRVSYCFGFQGPAITVDTACSSSLVTTHLAMNSLQNGECDVALAGGVNIMLDPGVTINCCKAKMLAEDGVSKSFSKDADGYGRGEGVGMLVLMRFNDAIRAGHTIHGIIRGSAVNQDGASSGLTVPNKQAQVQVITKALDSAGLSADDIDFIEAHGTGTLLGDPIEINALKEVFAQRNVNIDPIFINSVKSFIGHLEAAAGVAGIIRVLESFKHHQLTALPIHGSINPKIQLEGSCLAILQAKREWRSQQPGRIRRAGVSSFGFSGTNAHLILEEHSSTHINVKQRLTAQWAEETRLKMPERPSIDSNTQVLTLSAKDGNALGQLVVQYIEWLDEISGKHTFSWTDLAYSTQIGRAHFANRLCIQASSLESCLLQLKQWKTTLIKRSAKSDVQFIIPDLTKVDLSSLRQRYQEDVLFSALCNTLVEDNEHEVMKAGLNYLAGQITSISNEQSDIAKLIGIYALYHRYQRMGIQTSQLLSQGTGRFLAAVMDGRLTFMSMLTLFKAYTLKDESLLKSAVKTMVTYPSNNLWQVELNELCHDLFMGNLADQLPTSNLAIALNSGTQTSLLNHLSAIYLEGYTLNWRSLWQGSIRSFIQLPFYPFQHKQHRFEEKKVILNTAHDLSSAQPLSAAYQLEWQSYSLDQYTVTSSNLVLILLTARQRQDKEWMQLITKNLKQTSNQILCLSEGNRGAIDQYYTIRFDKADEWEWFRDQIFEKIIDKVIDLRYMDIQNEQHTYQQLSFSSYLSKRLYESHLCFQFWSKNITQGYIALFPQASDINEQIQLCHSGIQGQLRSIQLHKGHHVSAIVANSEREYLDALTELCSKKIDASTLRYEKNKWSVETLVPATIDVNSTVTEPYGKEDGVLITGGLGALGLTLAKWYARKGIGHIALISRSMPSEEQLRQIREITEQYSLSINTHQADVANTVQLTSLIQNISQTFKIREVFHLAGKASIKRLEQLTEQDYQDGFMAKVLGALNLTKALGTLPYWPKQVVLFSSVASLLPEPGQTTYASANRILDSLALQSRLNNKPIRVINWGLWGAAGAGAHPEFVKRIRKGSGVLTEAETQTWLNKILLTNQTQVAVLAIDWSIYQKHLTKAELNFVRLLLPSNASINTQQQLANSRQELIDLNESKCLAQLILFIKQAIVEVSGKPMDSLHEEMTFEEELGLDSNLLTAIKDTLQERIGAVDRPYAATILNDYRSIDALAKFLLADIAKEKLAIQSIDLPTEYIRQLVHQTDVEVIIKSLKKVSQPQEVPLIFIHTIMGSLFFYRALIEHLNYNGQIYGIDNPYFSNLTTKFTSLEGMAKAYALKIQEQFMNQPVRLAGLSFAGAVAYEVAQQLSSLGAKVDSVLMFDTAMPGTGNLTLPPTQRQFVMGEIAEDINEYYQAEINNNQRILNAYRPSAPINALHVILLKARSPDSVNQSLPSLNEVCNGWLKLFCPEVYSVPGSHFSLFDRAYINTTVQVMRHVYIGNNPYIDIELLANEEKNCEKLLLQAAKNGDSYLVLRLLKAGVNPMITDREGHHAACFAAENDDLCSLAWIHFYAKNRLLITDLFPWAIKGNALKTMAYLVEKSQLSGISAEPDILLLMDSNKQQSMILYGQPHPYQQREWMEILAAHNSSGKGSQQPSAMQVFPPLDSSTRSFDLMAITKITCGDRFNIEVVSQLRTGQPNKPHLFMIHAASGLALPYTNLGDLGFGNVYGISNPYFNQSELSFSSIEEMAQHYLIRIKQIQKQGPYYLAGWSLGGIVSQAIASRLEQQGERVGIVIMIDSVNHFGKPYYPNSEKASIEKILKSHANIDRYEGLKEGIQRCYLNTSEILQNYQAKPFSGRVVLLKADEHETNLEKDTSDLVMWRRKLLADPFSGWGKELPNLEVQSLCGTHNELFDKNCIPGVEVLLRNILATAHHINDHKVSLSQRWSMNIVKALRRNDIKMIELLMQQPADDYSYQDDQGNLLDVIVARNDEELLKKLDPMPLMRLQTSTGSKASDIALEFSLIELFSKLQDISVSSLTKSTQSFFGQSSSAAVLQGETLSLH